MFTADELFVRNIDILREAVKTPTVDKLFDSSATLRKLLVDGNPLLHQVNRDRRLRIEFEVSDAPSLKDELDKIAPGAVFVANFMAAGPVGPKTKIVNRDGFLKQPILHIEDKTATVLDRAGPGNLHRTLSGVSA